MFMDANTLKALKWNFTEITEDENPSYKQLIIYPSLRLISWDFEFSELNWASCKIHTCLSIELVVNCDISAENSFENVFDY